MNQSHITLTSDHSERTYTNATDTHTVPSTVLLHTTDHLKANDKYTEGGSGEVIRTSAFKFDRYMYVPKDYILTWRC